MEMCREKLFNYEFLKSIDKLHNLKKGGESIYRHDYVRKTIAFCFTTLVENLNGNVYNRQKRCN